MKTVDETDEGNWLIHCKCQSNDFEKASNCVKMVARLTLVYVAAFWTMGLNTARF